MAKISELKKVQLLEEAVLKNSLDEVEALFKEHKKFEFTARALGLACRFCGAEMVSLLLKKKASFKYEETAALVKKYDCKIKLSNQNSIQRQYELWVLPGAKVEGYNYSIIPDEERTEVLKVLKEKKAGDLLEILYYAVLYNDQISISCLHELGINELSDWRTSMISGNKGYLNQFIWKTLRQEEFQEKLATADKKELLMILNNYLNAMPVEKILLFPADLTHFVWGKGEESIVSRYCSVELFDFFARNTNLLEKAKKWEVLSNLVKEDNADGIAYVLDGTFVLKGKELDELLQLAQRSPRVNPALVGCIMEHKKKTQGQDNSYSAKSLVLNDSSLSVAEIKKIWGTKKLEDGTLKITSYKGDMTEIQIPEMIGKNTVSAIDEDAFNPNASRISPVQKKVREQIETVIIPGTIKEVPQNLFYRKSGYDFTTHKMADPSCLRTVILSEGIELIGDNAFSNSIIEELVIPDSVKEIGKKAFYGCERLKSVSFSKGLKKIGDCAFLGCSNIEKIIIPDSVEEIGREVFWGCRALKNVKLPTCITTLPAGLLGRTGIESFEISEDIKEIGIFLFSDCKELSFVELPNTMKNIPDKMFEGCESLAKIEIPKSVVKIGEKAFKGSGLVECTVPENVMEIESGAFSECKQLVKIDLPENIDIGEMAFSGCDGLANNDGQILINGILFGFVNTDMSERLTTE